MRIVVVGGGIAGLAAARRLRERAGAGVEIVLVERSNRLGGKLRTGAIAGLSVETGAEMFLVREGSRPSAAIELARRVGLSAELIHPASVPAALAIDGRLRTIPGGTLLGIPSDASTLEGLARSDGTDRDTGHPVLGPGEDVAVGRLVGRHLGHEVVERLVDPMLGGVYAGRADTLSLAATMPGLHREAQRHPTLSAAVRAALAASPRPPGEPVFATVTGGLSRLVVATAAAADVRVRHGLPVRGLARTSAGWRLALGAAPRPDHMTADGVVLAVPAAPAGRLLQEVDAETAADVGALDYASVALVTLAFPAGTGLPALSGLLVPAGEGYLVKAATFVTTKWPHLHRPDDPVLVRVSLGRHGEAEVLQRTDEELITLVREELPALIGADLAAPLAAEVTRWGGALPQYGVGHVERVAAARSRLPDTLALAGAALDGVGIAACVRSGEAAADAVWAALEQSNA